VPNRNGLKKVVANLLMMAVVCSGCSDNRYSWSYKHWRCRNKYRGKLSFFFSAENAPNLSAEVLQDSWIMYLDQGLWINTI